MKKDFRSEIIDDRVNIRAALRQGKDVGFITCQITLSLQVLEAFQSNILSQDTKELFLLVSSPFISKGVCISPLSTLIQQTPLSLTFSFDSWKENDVSAILGGMKLNLEIINQNGININGIGGKTLKIDAFAYQQQLSGWSSHSQSSADDALFRVGAKVDVLALDAENVIDSRRLYLNYDNDPNGVEALENKGYKKIKELDQRGYVDLWVPTLPGDKPVVRKLLTAENGTNDYEGSIKELKNLNNLRYPGIIGLYGKGQGYDKQNKKQLWGAFEAVLDGTLADFGRLKRGALRKEEITTDTFELLIKQLTYDTLRHLSYLENQRIVHRDIKTENILYNNSLRAVLCDFGFATKLNGSGVYKSAGEVGTPGYMSPEIRAKKPYTCKTDMWSMGTVVFEMLTGLAPNQFPQYREDWWYDQTYWVAETIRKEFKGNITDECIKKLYDNRMCFISARKNRQDHELETRIVTFMFGSDLSDPKFYNSNKVPKCYAFLMRCLAYQESRYSASAALKDPWFDDLNVQKNVVSSELLHALINSCQRLSDQPTRNILEDIVISCLAARLPFHVPFTDSKITKDFFNNDQRIELFQKIDTLNRGFIYQSDLLEFMEKQFKEENLAVLKNYTKLFASSKNPNKKISYEDFCKMLIGFDALDADYVFDLLDSNHDGVLSDKDKQMGLLLSKNPLTGKAETVMQAINRVADTDRNGKVDSTEFRHALPDLDKERQTKKEDRISNARMYRL